MNYEYEEDKNWERLQAARRLSEWETGDAAWANNILFAYFNPEESNDLIDSMESWYE